jgi:hypothetical protein
MGLHIEIVERRSVIVVKLSGPTDLASLNPLQAAVSAAISDGQEVVLDLTELVCADLGSLSGLIEDLGPSAAAHLKVVHSRGSPADQSPETAWGPIRIYPNVIEATRPSDSQPPHGADDLAEMRVKFDALGDKYQQAIKACRDLLRTAEEAVGTTQ